MTKREAASEGESRERVKERERERALRWTTTDGRFDPRFYYCFAPVPVSVLFLSLEECFYLYILLFSIFCSPICISLRYQFWISEGNPSVTNYLYIFSSQIEIPFFQLPTPALLKEDFSWPKWMKSNIIMWVFDTQSQLCYVPSNVFSRKMHTIFSGDDDLRYDDTNFE